MQDTQKDFNLQPLVDISHFMANFQDIYFFSRSYD